MCVPGAGRVADRPAPTRRDLQRAMHSAASGHLGRDPGRLLVMVGVGDRRHVAVYHDHTVGEWVHVTSDKGTYATCTRYTEAASMLLLNATVAGWQGNRQV